MTQQKIQKKKQTQKNNASQRISPAKSASKSKGVRVKNSSAKAKGRVLGKKTSGPELEVTKENSARTKNVRPAAGRNKKVAEKTATRSTTKPSGKVRQKGKDAPTLAAPSLLGATATKGVAINKIPKARVGKAVQVLSEKIAAEKKGEMIAQGVDGLFDNLRVSQPRRKAKPAVEPQAVSELAQKWASLQRRTKKAPVPYKMTERYEAKTAIHHKILGWGYILNNVNDRLEVLFEDGVKILISNYKR